MKYNVFQIKTNGGMVEDFLLLETDNEQEAIKKAQDEQYYIERDKIKNTEVEIRVFTDESQCDYNTVEF